ncbi:MAG: prephenate dehydrogenase/arogenate dehydrogenase family protein [Burkholderiales bacterium]
MSSQPFVIKKLALFGIGLIGGSFALALRRAGAAQHIVGVGRSQNNLDDALRLGIIDQATTDSVQAVQGADFVMLATPVGQMEGLLGAIAPHLSSNPVITDGGSTKQDVVAYARTKLGKNFPRFVPGHPIAGTEKSGATAADGELYCGRKVILTPESDTDRAAIEAVRGSWRACLAEVHLMRPAEHDAVFAAISHLPHLLAFSLVDWMARKPNHRALFQFAAGGFRDFTRIASSSPEMWRDICLANRSALLAELADYRAELALLQDCLERSDAEQLETLFSRARATRDDWLAETKSAAGIE